METILLSVKIITGLIFFFRVFFHIKEGRMEHKGYIAMWVPPDSPNRFRKNLRMARQHYVGAIVHIVQYVFMLILLSHYHWLVFVAVAIFSFCVFNWLFPIWSPRKYTVWQKENPYFSTIFFFYN